VIDGHDLVIIIIIIIIIIMIIIIIIMTGMDAGVLQYGDQCKNVEWWGAGRVVMRWS
jgi:hypothetical protein